MHYILVTLFYFTLLFFLYFTLLYFTFTLLYFTLLYFTLLYFTLLYFTLLYFTLLYFTLLYFTLLYFTLLYFTCFFQGNNTIWSQWSTWAPCDLSCQSKRQRYCHRRDRNLCPGANQHFIQVEGRVCSPHCVGKKIAHYSIFLLE